MTWDTHPDPYVQTDYRTGDELLLHPDWPYVLIQNNSTHHLPYWEGTRQRTLAPHGVEYVSVKRCGWKSRVLLSWDHLNVPLTVVCCRTLAEAQKYRERMGRAAG